MKYTIAKRENEFLLVVNGTQSICPFTAPIPVPAHGTDGARKINLMRMPCTTQCPHASFKDKKYKITCGSGEQIFDIAENPKKNESKPAS